MRLFLNALMFLVLHGTCRAASGGDLQFDVFLGHDGTVRPGAWNPAVVEIFNAGPDMDAVVEVSSDRMGAATTRVPIALPTNSRKRLTIPVFSTGTGFECRLLDATGRVLREKPVDQVRIIDWDVPLIGSFAESPQGGPSLPITGSREEDPNQPRVVRLRPEMFPDSALALESLSSIYLGASKASGLREVQIVALLQWVASGGQLIVGLDRLGDYTSMPWLQRLGVPQPRENDQPLLESDVRLWLDGGFWRPAFAFRSRSAVGTESQGNASKPALSGTRPWGQPIQSLHFGADSATGSPRPQATWMRLQKLGRGEVVVLGFNPEREPVRSWELRVQFWTKLCAIPPPPESKDLSRERVITSLDTLFADLVDTRQIRKVPISVLLGLLVLYLAVIGPGDRWLLGRIGRPVLTWLTFPTYVLLFSGLIYLIGYRLRSGQTEWNELQIIDVIPQQSGAASHLRCRTYGGLYSPATGIYPLGLGVHSGGIRGELRNLYGVRLDSGRVTTTQGADGILAEVQASLWMKNLVVTEWMEERQPLIEVVDAGQGLYRIHNRTARRLGPIWLTHMGGIRVVESLDPGHTLDWRAGADSRPLDEVLGPVLKGLSESVGRRERAYSGEPSAEIREHPAMAMAFAFGDRVDASMPEDRAILWPRGFSLSSPLDSDSLIIQAWMPDPGLLPPLNRFAAARGRRDTLIRLTVQTDRRHPGP